MPELPEVEIIRRGLVRHILGEPISGVIVRQCRLRWPVPPNLNALLSRQSFHDIDRRGKYLLFYTDNGCMLLHLGMSGGLQVTTRHSRPEKHDHIDFLFTSGRCLRFSDPRRFGSIHWAGIDPHKHRLLENLGPEPLSDQFDADYLFCLTRKRTQSIKTFIMNSRTVAGVGNIYANESLFLAGIKPQCKSGRISRRRCVRLADSIKRVLQRAIKAGGTTLRDFVDSQDRPGYFQHQLKVYGRAGAACINCNTIIRRCEQVQRATYYCPTCQK